MASRLPKSYELGMVCPYHPDAVLIEDHTAGDMICPDCGLVVGDRVIDAASEWEPFSSEISDRLDTKDNALRNGSYLSTHYPGGETLTESSIAKHVNKNTVKRVKRRSRSPLRSSAILLTDAFAEISQMADRLNLQDPIVRRAHTLFKQLHDADCLKGKCHVTLFTTCIYIACRQEGVPRTFKEVCAISKATAKDVGRCFMWLVQTFEVKLDRVAPKDFVSRFCGHLGLLPHVQMAASRIAQKAYEELDLTLSRSPVTVAAAAIYMASQASEDKKTLKEIGDISGRLEETIRLCYMLMLPRARELFPDNFKFCTPVEQLPTRRRNGA